LGMQIRLAHWDDLAAVNDIYNQAVMERFCTAHLSPEDMETRRHWFTGHKPERYPVFVSCRQETITGWVSLGPYRPGRQALAHVGEVSYYVDRAYRGQGIGSQLLGYAIDAAPGCGLSVLIAILLDRNPASMRLLEKFGFSRWGAMPGIALIGSETADHLYYGLKL
jgi:L-amino acid N-acyltransferase YncA